MRNSLRRETRKSRAVTFWRQAITFRSPKTTTSAFTLRWLPKPRVRIRDPGKLSLQNRPILNSNPTHDGPWSYRKGAVQSAPAHLSIQVAKLAMNVDSLNPGPDRSVEALDLMVCARADFDRNTSRNAWKITFVWRRNAAPQLLLRNSR